MLVTEITTHVEDALARFIQQYKGKPIIAGLMTALVQQIQDLEDGIFPIDSGNQIANAVGKQLDNIGTLVGLSRNGLTDQQYLTFLLGTIAEDNSDDTIQTLVTIVAILFSPTLLLSYEMFPAEVAYAIGGSALSPSLYAQASKIIQASVGGGIGLGSISICDPVNAFRLSDITSYEANYSFGTTPTSGTYSLFFGTNVAGPFAFNASAATIQAAINALNGLTLVTVTGSYTAGFTINWGTGAQVPISMDTNSTGETLNILNTITFPVGTGGGLGDDLNPGVGGLFAFDIYSNPAA